MKALTIKQPWADGVVRLGKHFENRSWPTNHRGPVAIHAGLGWDKEGVEFIKRIHPHRLSEGFFAEAARRTGRIVGLAEIAACVRLEDHPVDSLGPWATGPFCWSLRGVRELEYPLLIKGALGLWNLPELTVKQIEDQLLLARR